MMLFNAFVSTGVFSRSFFIPGVSFPALMSLATLYSMNFSNKAESGVNDLWQIPMSYSYFDGNTRDTPRCHTRF